MKGLTPPRWFYEMYDSITMGIPVHEARSTRHVPLYIRYRFRLVDELLKQSKMERAAKAKAMGVIDFGSL